MSLHLCCLWSVCERIFGAVGCSEGHFNFNDEVSEVDMALICHGFPGGLA